MLPVELDSIFYEPSEIKVASNDETVLISEIVLENEAYFDSFADDFVFTNIPIELTSSRYFVGYIFKE